MLILVCGGAGYIGSHMVRRLLAEGHRPVVLDNFSTGHPWAVERAFRGYGPPELVEGDVLNEKALEELFRKYEFEAVMHFSALALVGESVSRPGRYYHNNVTGALNLLRALARAGVDRFIFSSSCAVYGAPEQMPLVEDMPAGPVNPYGRSKWMTEMMMADFAAAHNLKAAALRYFNAAGAEPEAGLGEAHDPETHLIPNVIKSVLGAGPALRIFGRDYPTPDGSCVRDYIHVSDLAQAHLKALDFLGRQPGGFFDCFNLGTGRGVSNLEIIKSVARVSGRAVNYEFAPRRPGDPPELYAQAEKAGRVLGWRPEINDIDQIIDSAWRWHSRRV